MGAMRNWLTGTVLATPLIGASVAPLVGPAMDYGSGKWKREAQDQILSTTPDPETGYDIGWINQILHGKDAFTPEALDKRKDARALQIIEKDPALQKLMADHNYKYKPGDTATSIRTNLADAEISRQEHLKGDIQLQLAEKIRNLKQSDPWAIEDREQARETNKLQQEELKLSQEFRRYQTEVQAQERRERAKRDELDRQERRGDKKLAREQAYDLGMADLAFRKGEANRDYNLQIQKINRDSQLAHQAKIANIAAGLGALAMGFVA